MIARRLVIVADDLTGAGDTGVVFSRMGLRVKVIVGGEHIREEMDSCDVLVIDLESRMDAAKVAYEKHYAVGQVLSQMKEVRVYKKLDSTFRGNVGAEIDGLMDAMGLRCALMAAALPGNGRTIVGGEVYVRGVKLIETEAAIDPRTPVRHSAICNIVAEQSERVCTVIGRDLFARGVETAAQQLSMRMETGDGVMVFDSQEERDLEYIAGAIGRIRGLDFLMVGSSGLARWLAQGGVMRPAAGEVRLAGAAADGGRMRDAAVRLEHGLGEDGRLVFVFAGSLSEHSRGQVRHALDKGQCKLIFLDRVSGDALQEVVQRVAAAVLSGERQFIFTAAMTRDDEIRDADGVAVGMGALAAGLIKSFRPGGIVLTGGETAIQTFRALGATGIDVIDEVLPGVQYGNMLGVAGVDGMVVTKAGGFGGEDTILKIIEFLKYEQ